MSTRKMAGRAAGVFLMLLSWGPSAHAAEQAFKVIANPSVKVVQIKRQDLAAIFLAQARRWADGQATAPVDQSAQSEVRSAFSREVLGQAVVAVQNYWMQRISSRQGWPPTVKTSDGDVMAYVAATPGAIGYVSSGAALDPGVREVRLD